MAPTMALALSLWLAMPGEPAVREEADLLRFANGVVEVTIDRHTGAWRSFGRPDGQSVLGAGTPSAAAIAVRDANDWQPLSLPAALLGWQVRQDAGIATLRLDRRHGDWEVQEELTLRPGLDLLARSVTLTWRGGKPTEVSAVRLSLLGARAGSGAGCSLLVPERFPPEVIPYAFLQPGRVIPFSGQTSHLVAVHNAAQNLGLAAVALCFTDRSAGSVAEGASAADIHHEVYPATLLQPGQAVTIGTQYVRLVRGNLDALLAAAQEVYRLAGHSVPPDAAPDAAECAIYSAHAGGTLDSGFRDGTGFRGFAARIPYLADLGFNTFWMLPFWHGPVYAPVAYDRLDEKLGTEDDLRALVETAHRHGARVLGDLIPHGPRPESGLDQTHPEWISRDREGRFRFMWGCFDCDYAHPGWQQFMAEHAADWIRRVGLDGYRVDVALGQQENWRPHGTNRPGNSPVGGIQMLRRVRAAIRREKGSTVLLAEATHPGLWAACEMVYDFPFAYQVAPRAAEMPAAEFVPALRRWLQWQRAMLPDGALPMRYVESHDTARARLLYGPGLHRAFLGLLATIRGVPMLYDGEESGYEPFLRMLLAARRACPALTQGDADYLAVATSRPEVSATLRTHHDAAAIAATNFTGQRLAVQLRVPVSRLPERARTQPWRDVLGAPVRTEWPQNHARFTLSLPPYATAILVPASAARPLPARQAAPGARAAQLHMADNNGPGTLEHHNTHYRLRVDRGSGLLREVLAADGTVILFGMAIREGPRKLFLGSEPWDWSKSAPVRLSEDVRGRVRVLSFTGRAVANGQPLFDARLRYRLDDSPHVRVELSLTARRPIEDANGMLTQALRLPPGAVWFAQTHEGDLVGESAWWRSSERFSSGRYWHSMPWALWEDRLFPLAGSFGARVPGGSGVALHHVEASQPGWRQNLAILPPASPGPNGECRLELRWLDGKGPVSLPVGHTVTLAFTVTVLKPGQDSPRAPQQPNGPRLKAEGPRFIVENGHYRAILVRSRGGALVSLARPGRPSLLRDWVVYTDQGIYAPFRDPAGVEQRTVASSSEDIEPEISLERGPGRLVITVEGTLRQSYGGSRDVMRPLTRTRLRYTFDERPDVGVDVSIFPPAPTERPVFLAQRLHLAGVREWRAGDRRFAAAAQDAGRVWQSRETPLPPRAVLRFEGDGTRLCVEDLDLPESLANLFVYDSGGGNVTLFAAPNDMTPIPAQRWITFRYRLRPE